MRAFIVSGGDGFESLLSCCVPNVQFDRLVFDSEVFYFEINANCWEKGFVEDVVRESE